MNKLKDIQQYFQNNPNELELVDIVKILECKTEEDFNKLNIEISGVEVKL